MLSLLRFAGRSALVASLAFVAPDWSRAQVVDSLEAAMMARADSLRAAAALRSAGAAADSAADSTALGMARDSSLVDSRRGRLRPVSNRRPIADGTGEIADALARLPGSFLYDFGPDGWPDAWSPDGMDPAEVSLTLGPIPFDDPLTGGPAWDLLPTGFLRSVGWAPMLRGAPFGVAADLADAVADTTKLTELRYRSGGTLQAVDVTHSQARPIRLFGRPTRLGVDFGYSGAGAAGEYEGSRLRRKRQIFVRLTTRVAGGRTSLAILTNRHRVGAHAGVIPPGPLYESIYNRLFAGVENPTAVRERYRSDVILESERAIAGRAVSLTGWRTQQLLRYVEGSDSTRARVVRYGMEASSPVFSGPWPVLASISARTDTYRDSLAFGDNPSALSRLEASLRGSGAVGWTGIEYGGSAIRTAGRFQGAGHLGLSGTLGHFGISFDAVTAPVEASAVDRYGFGAGTVGAEGGIAAAGGDAAGSSAAGSLSSGRVNRLVLGTTFGVGSLRAGTRIFVGRRSGGVVWRATDESGGASAEWLATDLSTRGVVTFVTVRESAARGFHGHATATLADADPGVEATYAAFAGSLPDLFGRLVLGWRASLFKGDAIVDLRAECHAWTAMRGRHLSTATGLMVLAYPGTRDVPGSAILDIRADVKVRTATVYLSVENVLGGTNLMTGNQVVLDYPYPEQHFRFGVFWPIPD